MPASATSDGDLPRSLVWATSIDVLPLDRVVQRRRGYLVVRSPSNPTHWWGNLLVFDQPPVSGDRARWERSFAREFADQPRSRHRTFAWDDLDGAVGEARTEFPPADGYELECSAGLVASPEEIRAHPRANRDVEVRPLRVPAGEDEPLWDQVVELQVANLNAERPSPTEHRLFVRSRLADLRAMFRAGRGDWYVALAGDEVVGSCGVVVTAGRGRFQAVDTAPAHRRRGICSRLVVDAAAHAVAEHGARRLVIVADPEYHALGLYQSLGFAPAELTAGVCHPSDPD